MSMDSTLRDEVRGVAGSHDFNAARHVDVEVRERVRREDHRAVATDRDLSGLVEDGHVERARRTLAGDSFPLGLRDIRLCSDGRARQEGTQLVLEISHGIPQRLKKRLNMKLR
jgi:hypothetical protein